MQQPKIVAGGKVTILSISSFPNYQAILKEENHCFVSISEQTKLLYYFHLATCYMTFLLKIVLFSNEIAVDRHIAACLSFHIDQIFHVHDNINLIT